ncbi:MAG: hypothetical protein JWL59_2292 [Chthoniobacteraceae bacterium]|nr:hypothetical protein [Chthoniobacteraceae bacterium]
MLLPPDFLDKLIDGTGKRASFSLPDGRLADGTVELVKRDAKGVLLVQGRLTLPEPGFYFFQRQTVQGVAGTMVGNVRFDKSRVAFRVDPVGPGGAPMLVEHSLEQVVCMNLPPPDLARLGAAAPQNAPQVHPINIPIPGYQNGVVPLQSLPGATGVIYLDFDGEPGPFAGWGNFDAAPSGATNAQIKDVWQRVCEDYQVFNVNITTDRRVFDNAGQGHRQHCILTPTKTAAPSAGGVAFVGSFNNTGDTVCWAFYSTGKNAAEVVAHEVGHTLGLSHDGRISPAEDYYGGHGSGEVGWAPIMGVGYSENLVQWSKGEYLSANNTEDDLAIITNNNNTVDYRADDASATFATAPYLEILANNSVVNEGIIETRSDVDAFRFTTTGGPVSLTVGTVNAGPDLDILAEIYDSSNALIASNNPDTALNATVTATLPAGNFTLRVSGVGRGAPLVDGYTDYDSLGAYLISGTVANGVKPDRLSIAENSASGSVVGNVVPRASHGTNSLTYAIASGNTGTAFIIDPATGAITVNNSGLLNYESLSLRWDDPATFQLFVTIIDAADPLLNENIRVVITVTDVNEAPAITNGAVTIPEHSRIGTKVFDVNGSDPDRYEFPLFSIVAGNSGGAFAIDPVSGQISVAANIEATTQAVYTLTVRATDHGTPAVTADATVTVTIINIPAGYQTGAIVRTFYENITGNNVSNLTSNARFPNSPDSQQTLTSFDGGTEHGDNYGDTLRGLLIPPVTGNYTFWIASDDGGELRIGTNATPASAVVRATVANATNQYQWNANAAQQSVALPLVAGTPYYIEARHKEGGGADHIAVAWQGPGISQQVIGGAYLALQAIDLVSPRSPAVNIPAGLGLTIEAGNAGRTGTTFAWTKVSGPGTVTFDNATALSTGATFSMPGTYLLRCTESGASTPITLDLTVSAGVVDYGLTGLGIGAQVVPSAHTVTGGSYAITAAGEGIPSGGAPDDFYFISTPAVGNVTVTARVVSIQDIDGSNSRAGVMIRESLAADAREAFVGVTAANGGRFIYRALEATNSASASATVVQPYWVRLIRNGNTFTAQIAPDSAGTPGAFTAIGTAQTIAMGSGSYVGLAATSGSATEPGSVVIDHVSVTPTLVNIGANVNAGADASFPFPSDAILHGVVTDDAKPAPPGAVTTLWSLFSGPRAVTFANAATIDTTAAFTLPGLYTLRLTADDGAVKTFDSIVINASSATTVNVTLSDSAASEKGSGTGEFTFTRTGPTSGALTVNFTVSGSASVNDYAALPTTVVIPDGQSRITLLVTPVDDALVEGDETVIIKLAPGIYNLGAASEATLTIVDSDVIPIITITSPAAPSVNIPAGTGILLEATAIDDGLPNALTFTWSKVSGPGTVAFGSVNAVNTTATFSVAGTYVLGLAASDGQFTGTNQVTVNSGSVDYFFTGTKVGAQATQPSSAFAGGTYTLSAAGAGIPSTGALDDFFFLNIPITGDVTITARLVSVQNISASNSRSGVMIRESLAADAAEAFCGITSLSSGRGIFRDTAAATSSNVQATALLPSWIRLIRTGTSFTAQFAPDRAGVPDTFTTAGTPQTLSMGNTVFVGLAATSGSTSAAGTTVFDKITIVPGSPNIGAAVNAGVDATVLLPASVTLDGTVSDDGKPSPLITAWTKESGPGNVTFGNAAFVDTTAAFSAAGNYVLRLIANDGLVKTFDDILVAAQLTPIEQWRQTHFGLDAGNSAIAGDLANPDGDAFNNLLEYALGLDPLHSDSGGIVADVETIGPDKFLRLTITKNPAATDLTFSIEVTGRLDSPLTWSAADTTVEVSIGTQIRVRDNIPLDSAPQRNIRLKVTHP